MAGSPSSSRIRLMAVVMSRRESIRVPSRSKTRAAGRSIRSRSGLDEFGLDPPRQDARLVAAVHQELHGAAAGLPIIAGPVVDVHADEAVGAHGVVLQAAGVARGVAERLLPVVE